MGPESLRPLTNFTGIDTSWVFLIPQHRHIRQLCILLLYACVDSFEQTFHATAGKPSHTMTDKRILIIGGGTFGLSSAYHLSKAGYREVTVLEKGALIPSQASAGNDLNKIIRAEYEDPWYAELALVRPQLSYSLGTD